MRSLSMPSGEKPSQEEVLRRLAAHRNEGCVAHARVLLVHDEGLWIPACGRIDIARPEDCPLIAARPVGGARLLSETMALDDLLARLSAAFSGQPLVIAGELLAGHGMDSGWLGGRYIDSWREYGTRWPVVELVPTKTVTKRPYLHDTYAAEGEVEALDGFVDCLRAVLGYPGAREVLDARGSRFALYEWDYRGVFDAEPGDGSVQITVRPPGASSLVLSIVARDDGGIQRRTVRQPGKLNIPINGSLHRLNMTLRHGDDIVCELLWNEQAERFSLHYDGVYKRPPVRPEADPLDAGSTIAETVLPFVVDAVLARMVARDLAELDSAIAAANVKSAIVLSGSILEAVLLDVLGRNEHEVRSRLRKKWPDNASARDLIEVAASTVIALADGTTTALLSPLTAKKSIVVVDHRNLIHPRAEVRGGSTLDMNTVSTMRGVLGEVLRDLREAHIKGALDDYRAGKVI